MTRLTTEETYKMLKSKVSFLSTGFRPWMPDFYCFLAFLDRKINPFSVLGLCPVPRCFPEHSFCQPLFPKRSQTPSRKFRKYPCIIQRLPHSVKSPVSLTEVHIHTYTHNDSLKAPLQSSRPTVRDTQPHLSCRRSTVPDHSEVNGFPVILELPFLHKTPFCTCH